jgi:hypothetical protein
MLTEAGIKTSGGTVTVRDGVAAIELADCGAARRLAESVALSVPGVLEVCFTSP